MPSRRRKKIIIIAGPNGSGKTTFAQEFLAKEVDFPDFVNADLIARGLSPFAPETVAIQARRITVELIANKVNRGRSFAFETTLAGRSYARHIRQWQKAGYHVKLIFLSLPSVDLAIERVKGRVSQGGHHVPESIIRRRFDLGLRNFYSIYRKLVNAWDLYDNSKSPPVLLETGANR